MAELTDDLLQAFPFLQVRASRDCPAFNCPTERLLEVLEALKTSYGYTLLCDVTAIDWYEASPRFEVVYHLLASAPVRYVRIAVPCVGDEQPTAPSVVGLFPGANWHERETYDMFGITFTGHPDLRRILMWEGYPYFPLRKEFPLAGHETPWPDAETQERANAKVLPAPMMGGPFHAGQRGPISKREPRADDESWTETQRRPEKLEGQEQPREFREAARKEQ